MGLETGTEIQDLNPAWPLGTDDVSQGDDHIRLLKTTIQGSFPGMTAPWTAAEQDLIMRDSLWRTIAVTDQILLNPQVAIAATTIDGTGAITSPNYGVQAVDHTAEGQYEIRLAETGWNSWEDLQAAFSVNYGFGGAGIAVLGPAVVNDPDEWVSIISVWPVVPQEVLDPITISLLIFDAGRD